MIVALDDEFSATSRPSSWVSRSDTSTAMTSITSCASASSAARLAASRTARTTPGPAIAEACGAAVTLNELSDRRAGLLDG